MTRLKIDSSGFRDFSWLHMMHIYSNEQCNEAPLDLRGKDNYIPPGWAEPNPPCPPHRKWREL